MVIPTPTFEIIFCGSQRISALAAFELEFDAENTEIRRGRREIDQLKTPRVCDCFLRPCMLSGSLACR